MKKSELIEEIINKLEEDELINVDNYTDYDDVIKDVKLVLNKVLTNYVIVKGEIVE